MPRGALPGLTERLRIPRLGASSSVTHDASGALVGAGARLSLLHAASGTLAAPGAQLSATAVHSAPIAVSPTYSATSGGLGLAGVWTALVSINGASVTDKIIGEIRIDCDEGGARIADLTYKPTAGATFALADWVGKPLSIDVANFSSGSATGINRLFTGLIDTPTFNLEARTIGLRCTDNLQNIVEGMSAAAIDVAIPSGYYSPVIFDPAARGWSRAQDRLSTVPSVLDLTPYGAIRLTDWAPKVTPDLTFTDSHVLDGSVAVSLASRNQLTNQVDIDFGYRFPRVKAEAYPLTFSYVSEYNLASYVSDLGWFLQRAAVEAAIKAAGGTIASIVYTPLPNAPVGSWIPGPFDAELCMGFDASVTFDYAQQIEETHQITVSTPASISAVGTLRDRLSGALVGQYPPIVAVETAMTLYKNDITGIPPQDTATPLLGFTTAADVTLTADTDRSAANAAMQALIATAKVRIWGAHRQNSVSAAVPLNPGIDLDKTIELNVTGVSARGKCRSLTHRLDTDTGAAVTEFALAICSVAGTGVTHTDTANTAPAGSSPIATPLLGTPTVVFNGGNTQDHVITITFPGVEAVERDRALVPLASSYAAAITEDLFTLSL
jgi:hypothetical protein